MKITKVQVEETEESNDIRWSEAKSKKVYLLQSTDWTQLPDVHLKNKSKIDTWRQQLRDLNLKSNFDTPKQALSFLDEYANRLPDPIKSSPNLDTSEPVVEQKSADYDKVIEKIYQIEKMVNQCKDEIDTNSSSIKELCDNIKEISSTSVTDLVEDKEEIYKSFESYKSDIINIIKNHNENVLNLQEKINIIERSIKVLSENNEDDEIKYYTFKKCKNKLLGDLKDEKNNNLIQDGSVLDYIIINERIEQATDYLCSTNPSLDDYSLLYNDTKLSDEEFVEMTLELSKTFYKKIYKIEEDYLQTVKSIYNMTQDQLNDYLETNGYRYRCSK
jgi:hypothetical protein